ncbi:MAG TPA: hypothetical protein VH835_11555 [Dongiaceae bacterium]|jgi:hypothetical protein
MIGFVIRNFRLVCLVVGILGVCGTFYAMADDVAFNMAAVSVDATVDDIKVECYFAKRERVSRRRKKTIESPRMSCAQAEQVKKTFEAEGFKLKQDVTTHVVYTAPDGSRQAQWSQMTSYAGHDVTVGEHVRLLVDPSDPSAFRKPTTLADMAIYFLVLLTSALTALGAWLYGGSQEEYA